VIPVNIAGPVPGVFGGSIGDPAARWIRIQAPTRHATKPGTDRVTRDVAVVAEYMEHEDDIRFDTGRNPAGIWQSVGKQPNNAIPE
jgi:hypothetical protein